MKEVLYDQKWAKKSPNFELYYMYRGVKPRRRAFGSLRGKEKRGLPAQILKNKTWEGKGKPRVEAWVEIGKESRHHQKGPYFLAECQMRFPKKSLRSVAESEDLRQAITEVKDELQRELKQYKTKLIAHRAPPFPFF